MHLLEISTSHLHLHNVYPPNHITQSHCDNLDYEISLRDPLDLTLHYQRMILIGSVTDAALAVKYMSGTPAASILVGLLSRCESRFTLFNSKRSIMESPKDVGFPLLVFLNAYFSLFSTTSPPDMHPDAPHYVKASLFRYPEVLKGNMDIK